MNDLQLEYAQIKELLTDSYKKMELYIKENTKQNMSKEDKNELSKIADEKFSISELEKRVIDLEENLLKWFKNELDNLPMEHNEMADLIVKILVNTGTIDIGVKIAKKRKRFIEMAAIF